MTKPRDLSGGPYRSGGGDLACPRCGAALTLAAPDHPRQCSAGCGTWYGRRALEYLLDPGELTRSPRQWWRHGATLACPVCREPCKVFGRDAVTVDACAAHGMWLPTARQDAFTKMFGKAIKARLGWTPPAPASPASGAQVPATAASVFAPMTDSERLDLLTARVAELEREVAELRRRGR